MKISKVPFALGNAHQKMMDDIREHVKFDHYIWGQGAVEPDGTMKIDIDRSVCSFPDGDTFMAHYNNFHRFGDVLNRLHASFPESPIVWTDSKAREHTKASKSIEDWGTDKHVKHLMLSGISSVFGRTWLTLYRTARVEQADSLPAFTRADADYMRYSIPQFLYAAQKRWAEMNADGMPRGNSLALPEPVSRCAYLTPYEMFLVIAYAKRMKPEDIIASIASALPDKKDVSDVSAIRVAYMRALKKLEKSEPQALALLMGRQCSVS